MRAENVKTFEELRNRISGAAAAKLKPLTAGQVAQLRPRAIEANATYHATAGDEGGPKRDSDELVDGLRHLAAVRSGSGSNMPFNRGLEEILAEVQEVA